MINIVLNFLELCRSLKVLLDEGKFGIDKEICDECCELFSFDYVFVLVIFEIEVNVL